MKKCSLCWDAGKTTEPPYVWHKKAAPTIPSTKHELLIALSKVYDTSNLKELTKDELQHKFKMTIRGERHPNDCTHGMASKTKPELEEKCNKHGLLEGPAGKDVTKGALQSMLRSHWQEQVALANHMSDPIPKHGYQNDSWEVIDATDEMETALYEFGVAKDDMESAIGQLFSIYGRNHALKSRVQNASSAFEKFLEAMNALESCASQS